MTGEVEKLKKQIEEKENVFAGIEKAVIMIENQIRSERADIPADPGVLKEKYRSACAELDDVIKEIKENKFNAKAQKRQITEIKKKYDVVFDQKRVESWGGDAQKIASLGDEITTSENAISALEMRRHAAEQARDLVLVSLEAFYQDLHKKPAGKDPRMKAVLEEKEQIVKDIEAMNRELAEMNG